MLRLWNRLSRLGIDARVSPFDEKHIVLANQVTLLVLILDLVSLTSRVLWNTPSAVALLVVTILGHALTLVLNAAHRHFAARMFLGGWSIATTVAAGLLVPFETDAALILITVATGVWLVAPRRDWKWAAVWCALALLGYVGLEVRGQLGFGPVMEPAVVAELSRVNRFFALALIVGIGVQAFINIGRGDRLVALEREKSRALLLNVLPTAIADRLLAKPGPIADRFDRATVLFADLANFTRLAERTAAPELVGTLDAIFSAFDGLADKHGLEKIKTIGDAYMVAGGVPDRREGHERAVAEMALEMIHVLPTLPGGGELSLRIGIHTGPVVAGVIGRKKFSYDMWGDTVNTASRMESHGAPGRVHCSQAVRDALGDAFVFEPRGTIDVKGKGPMETFFLVRR